MEIEKRLENIEKEIKSMREDVVEQIDMLHSLIIHLNESVIDKL